jgi:hypothetical protein
VQAWLRQQVGERGEIKAIIDEKEPEFADTAEWLCDVRGASWLCV